MGIEIVIATETGIGGGERSWIEGPVDRSAREAGATYSAVRFIEQS